MIPLADLTARWSATSVLVSRENGCGSGWSTLAWTTIRFISGATVRVTGTEGGRIRSTLARREYRALGVAQARNIDSMQVHWRLDAACTSRITDEPMRRW